MDQNKSQHYNFTHETIPIMWHSQTDQFIKYADKDGAKFLKFWWRHLIENMGVKIESSPEGLGMQIKETIDKDGKPINIIVLTLPPPTTVGEVYYMFLVKIPRKTLFFDIFMARVPSTIVYALQLEGYADDGTPKTGFYELTMRARNVRIGDGCEPVLDIFSKNCMNRLKL
jgi:hypothetical protein